MNKDQYFPHDACAMGNGKLMELTAELGMEGYGIYWMLMEHLRQQEGYKSTLKRIKILARKSGVSNPKLCKILCDFGLFLIENEVVSSLGLSERMQILDAKRAKLRANGSKGGRAKVLSNSDSNSSNDKAVKESKGEESNSIIIKDDNPVCPAAAAAVQSWEKCVDALAKEQAWFDYMAMRSDLGKERFKQQYPEIIKFFKQHIISYGKESSITSLGDAKSYFSNFILPGKPPHQRLLEKLDEARARNPYRFEDISPDGKRSYCGMPIPDDAPPRPSANALWGKGKWE